MHISTDKQLVSFASAGSIPKNDATGDHNHNHISSETERSSTPSAYLLKSMSDVITIDVTGISEYSLC